MTSWSAARTTGSVSTTLATNLGAHGQQHGTRRHLGAGEHHGVRVFNDEVLPLVLHSVCTWLMSGPIRQCAGKSEERHTPSASVGPSSALSSKPTTAGFIIHQTLGGR
jgi:hypothetical protein